MPPFKSLRTDICAASDGEVDFWLSPSATFCCDVGDSKAFREVNFIDFALWHAANKMLDRQGSAFGRERLERETAEYQRLLAEADAKCYVANMYDVNRDCLLEDEACGISCLNRIAAMQQGTGPDMAAANMSAAVADIPLSSAVQNASNDCCFESPL